MSEIKVQAEVWGQHIEGPRLILSAVAKLVRAGYGTVFFTVAYCTQRQMDSLTETFTQAGYSTSWEDGKGCWRVGATFEGWADPSWKTMPVKGMVA